MKLLLLGICLASVLSGPGYHATSSLRQGPEQETPGHRGGPGLLSAAQLTDLKLSVDQQERVDAIFQNQQQQLDDLRSLAGTDYSKMSSRMRKLETQTTTQLKAVLTSEQYAQYQAKKKERSRLPKDGQAPPPPRDSQ